MSPILSKVFQNDLHEIFDMVSRTVKAFHKNCYSLWFCEMPFQCVRSFDYLDFQINVNGKFRNLVQDCILTASKMSNMVLWAIGHNDNASVKLAISSSDKQSIPARWSLPDTQNLYTFWVNGKILPITQDSWSRLPSPTEWAEMCRVNTQRVGKRSAASNWNILFGFIALGQKWGFASLSTYSVCFCEVWYWNQSSCERQHREGTYCLQKIQCH